MVPMSHVFVLFSSLRSAGAGHAAPPEPLLSRGWLEGAGDCGLGDWEQCPHGELGITLDAKRDFLLVLELEGIGKRGGQGRGYLTHTEACSFSAGVSVNNGRTHPI